MNLFHKFKRWYLSNFGGYEAKAAYLRQQGAKIGNNFRLNGDLATFGTEPYLIEIGNDCLVAKFVKFVNHDGGVKVLNSLNKFDGKQADKIDKIKIGNNTYIGMHAFILPGCTIGNNCIIGAMAVVTKNIPDNSIAVGIPAKVVSSIDEYYEKCKDKVDFTAGWSQQEKRKYYEEKFK